MIKELRITDSYLFHLKIDGLKKLKVLTVPKLAHLDILTGMENLLELSVMNVSECELRNHDFSIIAQRFKNLQKCRFLHIGGYTLYGDPWYPQEYVKMVETSFQNSTTKVEIIFMQKIHDLDQKVIGHLIKPPFQRPLWQKIHC